jgi:hypothetical protein
MTAPAWRATSRPTSSSRRSGPMGMPNRRSARSTLDRGALAQQPAGLVQVRREDAVDEEARPVVYDDGRLLRGARERDDRRERLVRRVSPRITSTSGMRWTGLKKCMPAKSAGRSSALCMLVTDSDDVFVASTQPSARVTPSRAAPAASHPAARRPPRSRGRPCRSRCSRVSARCVHVPLGIPLSSRPRFTRRSNICARG